MPRKISIEEAKERLQHILEELDESHNAGIDKSTLTYGSGKNIMWKCLNGHNWTARVADRVNGNDCPYCSGKKPIVSENDLATVNPELAKEWNYLKNSKKPSDYLPHSGKKVWWICKNGHEWEATIDSRQRGNGCKYCAGQAVIPGNNDLATKYPEYLSMWDYEKNDILPTEIMPKSGIKVFWKCEKGHSWKKSPNEVIGAGYGCPICNGVMKTSFPEQAIAYYVEKYVNVDNRFQIEKGVELDLWIEELKLAIEYDGIYFHSSEDSLVREKKKDEVCKKKGIRLIHIKEIRSENDARGDISRDLRINKDKSLEDVIDKVLEILEKDYGIKSAEQVDVNRDRFLIWDRYYYADLENSIVKTHPNIVEEWDYEKNGSLLPVSVSAGAHKKVYWICDKGHSYPANIDKRCIEGTGCPYCSNQKLLVGYNDLGTRYPELSAEWYSEKNENISPSDVLSGSPKKVWWKCAKCKGEWDAEIRKRAANGQGCPYCAGRKILIGYNDLQTTMPSLAKEWDFEVNKLKPTDVTKGSNKNVGWVCSNCGNKWEAKVNKRSQGKSKCPKCKSN